MCYFFINIIKIAMIAKAPCHHSSDFSVCYAFGWNFTLLLSNFCW